MENAFESKEWSEAIRLLHKFVPLSNYISKPQELNLNSYYELVEAWDPAPQITGWRHLNGGSGDIFEQLLPNRKMWGTRALVKDSKERSNSAMVSLNQNA